MWVRRTLILGLVAWLGCNAELGPKGALDAPAGADAAGTIDAPPTPDAPACSNGRVVYLNFEGQALTAGLSDSTLNRASWMNIASGTAPPFRAGSGTRAQDIQTITDGVRAQLSQFPVTVVTQRPVAGPYVMIVFGGAMGDVGSLYTLAVNQLDCGDVNKNDVAWIADGTGYSLQQLVNTAVGAIGFGLGLTATNDPNDCMCSWGNACQPTTGVCTLSSNIARDPQSTLLCAGLTTQNEVETFRQAFCQ